MYHAQRTTIIGLAVLLTGSMILWCGGNAIVRILVHHNNRSGERSAKLTTTFASAIERTEHHYGQNIDRLAREFDLPPKYLKALIVLECSGRDEVPSRFEPHVYRKLVALRDGKTRRYGGLKRKHVKDASNAALRNLASSWGPFQLMGYQCVAMKVNVHDIRGDSALYWGLKWIDKVYGKKLRKGRFRDAFHIHNTGRPFPRSGGPRTHDPRYCDRGLSYMVRFKAGSTNATTLPT